MHGPAIAKQVLYLWFLTALLLYGPLYANAVCREQQCSRSCQTLSTTGLSNSGCIHSRNRPVNCLGEVLSRAYSLQPVDADGTMPRSDAQLGTTAVQLRFHAVLPKDTLFYGQVEGQWSTSGIER
jgi:hypothetical protein